MRKAKLFIWDLDNVIYQYSDAFEQACHRAAGQAAIDLGLEMTPGDATARAEFSYKHYGRSIDVFYREHGLSQDLMHDAYHRQLNPEDFVAPDHRMALQFQQAGVTHAILTHGSTDWAHRVLKARAIAQHFKPAHVIGIEQVGHVLKSDSVRPFEHVLQLTGHAAGDALMIEDTGKNLLHPNAMGMETVFIGYGKPDTDGHAKHSFDTAQDFLEAYCALHAASALKR